MELFEWKKVNGKDFVGESSFFSQILLFGLRNGIFLKLSFRCSFCLCAKIQFRLNWCNFSIGNGSTDRTPYLFIVFRPNSIISASEMVFFFKIFDSVVVFFFAPEFSFRQISANFRFEIGQWEGLPWRIIVFQPNSIVSISEMAFFKISFRSSFFLCAKIQFRLSWCNFSIGNGSTDRTP